MYQVKFLMNKKVNLQQNNRLHNYQNKDAKPEVVTVLIKKIPITSQLSYPKPIRNQNNVENVLQSIFLKGFPNIDSISTKNEVISYL